MRHAFLATTLLCLTATAYAEDATVPRYLELRDGSILRLPVVDEPLKVSILRTDGHIEESTVRLAELQRLSLTPARLFEKKRAILSAVQQLGSDEFAERERANKALLEMGPAIRTDLTTIQHLYTDVEIRARLRDILAQWPEDTRLDPIMAGSSILGLAAAPGRSGPYVAAATANYEPLPAELPFDVFTGKDVLWGDAGENGVAVRLDGKTYRVQRRDLVGLSVKAPEGLGGEGPRLAGGLRRLQPNEFPPGCMEEGFESTPDGRRLKVGENVERLFIKKGFLLSTSVKKSYVSVNEFVVQGKTRGMSCATHEPLFTGEVTITFVRPGQENVPAGVHYFGLWIAWIEVNGTALHAYDFQGREIGHITTTRQGHEFLGMYSPVPIHSIRVVPNLKIDPDYTLDDFIYTVPQAIDAGNPERCIVQFTDGERVLCKDVRFTPEGVLMQGLSAGLPDRTRPLGEVVRLTTPEKGRRERPAPDGVYVELLAGSVVFGARPKEKGTPLFALRPQTLKEMDKIVGLWNTAQPRLFWPAPVGQLPVVGLTDASNNTTWQVVTDVKLGEETVEYTGPAPGKKGREKVTFSYFETPPLLLRQPAGERPGSWRLRTAAGDDLVLSATEPPKLTGQVSSGVAVLWDGKEIKLTSEELVTIYRVPKGP